MKKENKMDLQEAIEKITYRSDKFPKKEFEIIRRQRDEAIPYLRQAVEKAVFDRDDLDEDYQLHFYALFLLGEFQDRESFSKIMELASLPSVVLDYLIGDAITSGLPDVVYNTYNGDLELLKSTIMNIEIDEFVRPGMLRVMGQLYLDGTLEESEWKQYIKTLVYDAGEYDPIYNEVAVDICRCHFIDMLPEIRYLYEHELLDEGYVGKYDSHVDYMFQYRDYERNFCESPINATKILKNWAMFEDEKNDRITDKEFEKMVRGIENGYTAAETKKKIGRNDPCPCGSGKKYKFCCMNKPKSPLDAIETEQERKKWLRDYPETGTERKEGRIYIEDYFDSDSIEIDKILYLGLMHRAIPIWQRNEAAEENRTRAYLEMAFSEFVKRVEQEQIKTFGEYDEKYSIHYRCEEWMNALLELLEKHGDKPRYKEVMLCYKSMTELA